MNKPKILSEADQLAYYWSPAVDQYFCKSFFNTKARTVMVEKSERHELIRLIDIQAELEGKQAVEVCHRCETPVDFDIDDSLKHQYVAYCPNHDEDLMSVEIKTILMPLNNPETHN